MKIRDIAVSLLAILLLCGSSWASACDLSCQLRQSQPVCAATPEHSTMAMECGHCPPAARNTQSAVISASCGAMNCGHPVLVAAGAGVEDHSPVAASPAILKMPGQASPVLLVERLTAKRPPGVRSTVPPPVVSLRL